MPFMKNIIRKIIITLDRISNTDTQNQGNYMDNIVKYTSFYPYGLIGKAKKDSMAMLFSLSKDHSHLMAMEYDNKKLLDLFTTVEPGEVAIYHPDKGSYVIFKNNGDIQVVSVNDLILNIGKNVTKTIGEDRTENISGDDTQVISGAKKITANTLNITSTTTHNGNVTINGDIQVNGKITATGLVTGSGLTTAGALTSATASIGSKDFASHQHDDAGTYSADGDPVIGTSGGVV